MTDPTPGPEPATLDQIATAAAALIADARATGLMLPFSLTCHDYGPPGATLYLYAAEQDTPAVWAALWQWADHYGTDVTSHPGSSPGIIHAVAAFDHHGLRYEVSAVIRPEPDTDDQADPWDQAA